MNEAVQIPDEIGSDSRPAHILGVAKDEFLANGFAATTMDGIAKAARISKQTLYKHFHDKADLLEAVIIEDMQSFRSLPDLTQDKRDPRAVLVETARWVYDNHVGWASVSMSKILIGAAANFGALIKRHHDFRFRTSVSWIECYFRSLDEAGLLKIADPHRAAVRFALMASQGSAPIMDYEAASGEERERLARMTVEMFMKGLGRPA